MVAPAERGEVVGVGLAGWTTVVEVDVWLDVVEVAAPGSSMTAGKHADRVTEADQGRHPRWWVVPVDGVRARQVEDRLELDGGVGQPGAEHIEEHRPG
jgi:hypothetical protein